MLVLPLKCCLCRVGRKYPISTSGRAIVNPLFLKMMVEFIQLYSSVDRTHHHQSTDCAYKWEMSRAKGCSLSYYFLLSIKNSSTSSEWGFILFYSFVRSVILSRWAATQKCLAGLFWCCFSNAVLSGVQHGQQIFNFFFYLHKDVVPASTSRDQANQTNLDLLMQTLNSEVSRCLSASIYGPRCALNVWWEFLHFIFIYFLIILGPCASSILASRRPLHVQYQPLCRCERCVSASVTSAAHVTLFKCSVLFFPHVFLICPGEGMQEAATICKSNFKVGDCFAFVLCSHIAVSRVTNSHWQLLLYPFGYTWISLEKLQICKKCIEEVTNILHKYSDCQQDKKQQRTDNAGQIKMLKICSDHPLIPIEIIFIPAEIIFGVSFFP